jgi:hypothetical protein
VDTAAAASRFPTLRYEGSGGEPFYLGALAHAAQANNDHHAVFYGAAEARLQDLYVNLFIPIPCQPKWLEAGSKIIVQWEGIQAGDQVSDTGFLIEDVPA